MKDPYKLDMLVDDEVIVELKSVSHLVSDNFSQLATYLWLANKKIGLLINFSARDFRSGVWNKENPDYNMGIVRVIQSVGSQYKGGS